MDDFGTGLRAHLGLDAAQLGHVAGPDAPEAQPAAELVEEEVGEPDGTEHDGAQLDVLAALEAELSEREQALARREAALTARAGALLQAAQALHDEIVTDVRAQTEDELARLRRRKSVA